MEDRASTCMQEEGNMCCNGAFTGVLPSRTPSVYKVSLSYGGVPVICERNPVAWLQHQDFAEELSKSA